MEEFFSKKIKKVWFSHLLSSTLFLILIFLEVLLRIYLSNSPDIPIKHKCRFKSTMSIIPPICIYSPIFRANSLHNLLFKKWGGFFIGFHRKPELLSSEFRSFFFINKHLLHLIPHYHILFYIYTGIFTKCRHYWFIYPPLFLLKSPLNMHNYSLRGFDQ